MPLDVSALAQAAGGAGPGGFIQGAATGLQAGTEMFRKERITELTERAEQAQHLDRALKLFDAIDQYPDKAEAIKAVGKKYGIDVDALGDTNYRPESTLVKLQRGDQVPDDELTALLHYAHRDKSGVMRTQIKEFLERSRRTGIQGRFNAAMEQYKRDNPGASDVDAQRALAAGNTEFREVFAGPGGIKETIGPELSAEQKLTEAARPKVSQILDQLTRGVLTPDVAVSELMRLPGGREAIAATPALKAHEAGGVAAATEQGKVLGLNAPVPAPPAAPPAAPPNLSTIAPFQDLSSTAPPAGRPSGLVFPGQARPAVPPAAAPGAAGTNLGELSGVTPPPPPPVPAAAPPAVPPATPPATPGPPKTIADLKAEQAGKEAEARVTSVQKGHLTESQKRTDILKERADAYVEMKNRVGATIKTLEGTIQQTAMKTFPDDPVKQAALAARLKNMLTGISSMMNSDQDAATIEQNIRDEIRKMQGEIPAATGAQKQEVGGWFSSLLNAIKGTGGNRPAPGRGTPKPPTAAPAPATKAAADSVINQLYPGRQFEDLTTEERQRVLDRLNSQ